MGANRLRYFPFDVGDYLSDPAVLAMGADSEGCFIRLLARSWQSGTPGVVPKHLVHEMAGLYRVGEDDYVRVLEQLEGAFEVGETHWTQKRMVAEHEKLSASLRSRQAGAKATNDARLNGHRNGERTVTATVSARSPAEEVEVDLEVEESKSTHLSPNGDVKRSKRVKRPKYDHPLDKEWMETFDQVWWPDFLTLKRRCSMAAAREVWAKIPHQDGQADFDRLNSRFESDLADWRATRGEPRFYPHADKWLRDYLKNLALEA